MACTVLRVGVLASRVTAVKMNSYSGCFGMGGRCLKARECCQKPVAAQYTAATRDAGIVPADINASREPRSSNMGRMGCA